MGRAIQTDRADGWLALAVALLAVADLTTSRTLRVLTAGLGAVTLATTIDPAGDLPSGLLALLTLALIGWSWPRLGSAVGRFTAVLLFAGASLGVYATVPDTEEIILAGVVVVPCVGSAGLARDRRTGPVGPGPARTGRVGRGPGRPRPTGRGGRGAGLPRPGRRPRGRPPALTRSLNRRALVLAVHAAATVVIARVAGPETSAATAALIAAPVALGTVAADALVLRVAVDDRVSERMG